MTPNFKRLLALLLSAIMVFGMMPTMAFAAEDENAGIDTVATGNVAKVGNTEYATIAAAIAAATAGDTVTVIENISDEAVTVDKNLTITGTATLNNVSINADGADELTVSGLTFTGNSWINSGTAEKLTVSGVTANVAPVNISYTNSRSGFISLGRSEQQTLELTVENCSIVTSGDKTNPIIGWAQITKATITGNTFGATDAYQTDSDSIKFMSIADGASFTITGNKVYSNYNGIVFGQNTTRANKYSVVLENNEFYGSADHIWIEVSGANPCHATVKAASNNTVNGVAFKADDIKATSRITNWTSYAGVDVVTDENGKVIGGNLKFYAADAIAEGYELDENGKVVVAAPAPVAKIGETEYTSLADALAAAQAGDEIVLLADVAENVTAPADIIFNGNGFAVNGTLTAGGNLTFKGKNTVNSFSAGYYNHIITIGEGASLKVNNSRVTVSYGNVFNIIGSIENAKTADKNAITPSLEIVGGLSFNGNGGDVKFNVTNAYVILGDSGTKNSGATGNFNMNFTNSIVDFTKTLKTYMPTASGLAPEFNMTVKDSVVSFASHLELWLDNTNLALDNSDLTVGGSFANAGEISVTNGSNFVVKAPIMSSHGGNTGSINVTGGTFELVDSNQNWVNEGTMSVGGTGKLIVNDFDCGTNGKLVIDATGMNVGDSVKAYIVFNTDTDVVYSDINVTGKNLLVNEEGKLVAPPVAKIGETGYATIAAAIAAAQNGDTVVILPGEYEPINISNKNITIKGTVGDNGELLTVIKGGNPAITGHGFNGTIADLKIVGAFKVMYAEPAGNVTVDNVYVSGATYGFHLVAYSKNLTWTIQNSYMDLSWANSFGVHGDGDAAIVIKGNKFASTSPYYPDYGALAVNTFMPNLTVEGNVFGAKTRIYVDKSVTDTSKINVSKNYHADGVANAFADDVDGVKVDIDSYYADEALTRLVYAPKGSNGFAYTGKDENGNVRVWGEGGGNASESFVLKLYSGETLIATTKLNNVEGIIDGDVYVTWHFFYPNSNDAYWITTWEAGHPRSDAQPTHVDLIIDGTVVATTAAKMSGADGINPVIWKDLGGVKYIVTGLSGTGTATDPYLINNVEELLWFQAKVDEQAADGSTQFAGKYFKLTSDIDLSGINWNPIGSMTGDHGSFKGVFDGDGHTISNLYVEQAGNGLGLFAYTTGNAVIKNLKLENVTVKSNNNSNYVGGLIGDAFASTKIENVHISGDVYISGCGYIGGIVGHGYVVMDNVSVKANAGGRITSTFWCAGGILGYAGEGSTNITNAHVEGLTITSAAGGLGAIVGMAEDNNGTQPISGSNLSAKNVVIETYVGGYGTAYEDYAMGYLYGGSEISKLTGNLTVENVTVKTASGNPATIVDADALVNGKPYFDLAAAFAAAQAGDTVTIFEGTYAMPAMKAGITVVGKGNVLLEGTLTGTLENLTLKNLHIKGGNAQRWAYAKGNLVFENVTFEATSVYALHFDGITAGATLLYKDCTIIGWAAMSGSPESCVFDGCTFKGNGTYGLIRTYFDATIKNCTFDVDNVNTTDIYQDGIHAVSGAIVTVNNCTNVNGEMIDVVNVAGTSVVVLDGVEIKNVAKIGDNYYLTLAAAINDAADGATITIIADHKMGGSDFIAEHTYGYETYILIEGKTVTIDFNGYTVTVNVDGTGADAALSNCIESVIFVGEGGNLTLKGEGGITTTGADLYCLVYNSKSTLTVENGTYNVEAVKDSVIYADVQNTTNVTGGVFTLLNILEGTADVNKPWMFNVNGKDSGTFINVTGGTYNQNPLVNYGTSKDCEVNVPEGYVVYDNGNGTWTVKKAVAKIGTTYYETLAAAIAAAAKNDTIELIANVTENVTVSKSITIDGAGKTYTGKMTLTNKADVTIKNVNFDGKGYNGYAVESKGAYYVTIEECTAKNYGYGFVQLASGTALTTVKNVTVSNMNYGVKVDYSNAVVLENANIDVAVAAVLNSNYGGKTITIKNSDLSILGTWTRNNTIKTTYVFEGANTVDKWLIDAAIDNFKLAVGATLTAPNEVTVTTDVENSIVKYENGKYSVEKVEAAGVITSTGHSISLEGNVWINKYANFEGFDGIDLTKDAGLLIWTSEIAEEDAVFGAEGAIVKEGLIPNSGNEYGQITDGIVATKFGDKLYMRFYVKVGDHYEYGAFTTYSVETYCRNKIEKSNSDEVKKLCAAVLNYGALAQIKFNYNTDNLVNNGISAELLTAFSSDMIVPLNTEFTTQIVPSANIVANGKTISLDEGITINYYYKANNITVATAELLTWRGVSGELTYENAVKTAMIDLSSEYGARGELVPAAKCGETIYACARFTDADGNVYYSNVVAYSAHQYAANQIAKNKNVDLLKAFIVYSNLANEYFN